MTSTRRIITVLTFLFLKPASASLWTEILTKNNNFKFFHNELANVVNNNPSQCLSHLRILFKDVASMELWAIQMIDASGKIQPGLLRGNFYQAGHYDECLAIQEKDIKGQYCNIIVSSKTQTQISFNLQHFEAPKAWGIGDLKNVLGISALCLPTSCTVEDVKNIWDYIAERYNLTLHVSFSDLFCDYKDKPKDAFAVDFYIHCLFVILIVTTIVCTIYDKYSESQNGFLTSFSLSKNLSILFQDTRGGDLEFLNGFRVLCTIIIMLGHRRLFDIFWPNINFLDDYNNLQLHNNFFVSIGFFSVVTFLTLTGFLVTYGHLNSPQEISVRQFYFKRITRFYPQLVAVILFSMSVFKYLGDGPAWQLVSHKISSVCYENWWITLLGLSNVLDIQNQCVEQTWYLSLDFQLYLVTPIFIFSLKKRPKPAIFGMIFTISLSVIYTFFIYKIYDYKLSNLLNQTSSFLRNVYFSPLTRIPQWLIGVYFGYLVYKHQQSKIRLRNFFYRFLSIFSVTVMFLLPLATHFLSKHFDHSSGAFYFTFVQISWSLALSGFIYSFACQQENIVNRFLSSKIFVVLNRLSYGLFLVHLMMIYYFWGQRRVSTYSSNLLSLGHFFADFVNAGIVASILFLTVEAPFQNILRHLHRKSHPDMKID